MKTIAILCALVACSHPERGPALATTAAGAIPPSPARPDAPPVAVSTTELHDLLTVRMQLRARHDRIAFEVEPGDTLFTKDYVELCVEVNAKAYVYVVQLLSSGNATVLFPSFPSTGDVAFAPGRSTRIPLVASEWFQLDDDVGTETVYVVASRDPIANVDDTLGNEIRTIRHAGAARDPGAQPAPVPTNPSSSHTDAGLSKGPVRSARPERLLTMANRGLRNVVKVDGRSVVDTVVPVKGDSLVVAQFSFHHER